jgi:hypothetical protein
MQNRDPDSGAPRSLSDHDQPNKKLFEESLIQHSVSDS